MKVLPNQRLQFHKTSTKQVISDNPSSTFNLQLSTVLICPQPLFHLVFFNRQINEFCDEFGVSYPTTFPELWIHAYLSEAGNRVNLAHINLARSLFHKKIHSPHSCAVHRWKGSDGVFT